MKTIKYFCLSALALTLAACSNDDNEVTQQPAEQVQGIPFTATISIGQSGTAHSLRTARNLWPRGPWARRWR